MASTGIHNGHELLQKLVDMDYTISQPVDGQFLVVDCQTNNPVGYFSSIDEISSYFNLENL